MNMKEPTYSLNYRFRQKCIGIDFHKFHFEKVCMTFSLLHENNEIFDIYFSPQKLFVVRTIIVTI